jgi:Dolichyl-phosphate-mannose-protein mannosyltransferase
MLNWKKMPGLAEVGNEIPRSSALPRKQAESHRATGLILFVLFFAFAFGIQRWSGTLQPDSEAAHYPDEPAHVVTSLMIHDYVKAFFPGSPQRFAETYYLHYPKVAFGIWPPVFHITAAIWMLIFGASKRSLLLLIASQAAVLASLLFRFSRGIFGPALSAALCAGFLISFPMGYNATMVMLDVLVALLAFCSMLCLLRFFETRKTSDGMAFGVVTAVAMLTKGNADALVLMPVALILLTRQWDVLKTKGL